MKSKKLVSAITALTLIASTFFCVSLNAEASELVYSDDFETNIGSWTSISGSLSRVTDTDGNGDVRINGKSGYVLKNGPAGGSRTAGVYPFSSAPTSGVYKIIFDMRMDANNTYDGKSKNSFRLTSTKETNNWFQDEYGNSTLFSFDQITNGSGDSACTYKINNETTSSFDSSSNSEGSFRKTSGWLNFELLVDLDVKTVTYAIKRISSGDTLASGINNFTASSLLGLEQVAVKSYGGIFMDDISITQLFKPSFTLSKVNSTPAVGATDTVTLTNIVGNVSVDSTDNSIARAEYDNGTVTITGVSSGNATITVTSTSDGYTKSEDISVAVGSLSSNVTIHYVGNNGSTIASDNELTSIPVGTVYDELSDILGYYENEIIIAANDANGYTEGKYVNPSISVCTVVDGTNEITVTYEYKALVSELTINYMYNNVLIDSGTQALSNTYVGDTAQYYYPVYVKDESDNYYTPTVASVYGNTTTISSTTPSVNANYTLVSSDIVYYAEAENFGANDTVSSAYSAGKTGHMNGTNSIAGQTSIGTYSSGIYTAYAYCTDSSKGRGFVLRDTTLGENNDNNAVATFTMSTGNLCSVDFVLTSNTTLYLTGRTATGNNTRTNQSDDFDYIYIVKTGDYAVTFEEQAAFVTEYGTTGTVRFNTKATPFNLDKAIYQGHGFALINLSSWNSENPLANSGWDENNTPGSKVVAKTTNIGNSEKVNNFYYEITGIKSGTNGVQFYAVPYIMYNSLTTDEGTSTFWGDPFTYDEEFNWKKAGTTTDAAQYGSVVTATAVK